MEVFCHRPASPSREGRAEAGQVRGGCGVRGNLAAAGAVVKQRAELMDLATSRIFRLTMKRHRSHQIDQLAQQILHGALPPTWVLNEQSRDYAKDYLVEVGEEGGSLTGSSFYIQLKGQEQADFSAGGSHAKYSLQSKYARYYLEQITDLPVFLVVVDVNQKAGWWLFLQPALEENQLWRKQGSITLRLPTSNVITNTADFRAAVEGAKKWMRLHHPESIQDSVTAHKQRIIRTDPRFDVRVSLVNDKPWFTLLAREDVPVEFEFTGDKDEIGLKVSDMFDKGETVAFRPGEVRVTGSKLFDRIEREGCEMQFKVDFTGTSVLVCHDPQGNELARLGEVPGRFTGGRKEVWFNGELAKSPFIIKLGPLAESLDGSVKLDMGFHRWDGQHLMQLAFFDRLSQFFCLLPASSSSSIECYQDGNTIFSTPPMPMPLQDLPFARPLARYLDAIGKARKVCGRFGINPIWTVKGFDRDAQETADQLYAMFFSDGWRKPRPNLKMTATCVRETCNFDILEKADKPGPIRFDTGCTFSLLGEEVDVARAVFEYTDMSVSLNTTRNLRHSLNDTVKLAFVGTDATVETVRLATPDETGMK